MNEAAFDTAWLKTYIRGLLADYEAPRHYVMTETVPRANNGKANYKTAKTFALEFLSPDK